MKLGGMWDSVLCSCLMVETIGILCSHIFTVMKVENIRTIPNCVILGRWTKNAKTGVSPHKKKEKSNSPYMSMEARLGSLHAACRNLQRLAASSCATFELTITDAHNLSLRLEALIYDKDKDTLEG